MLMAGGESLKGLNKPVFLLIVIAGMERFAFKGVASNLVTYLTDIVKMSNSHAAKTVNSWCGLTFIMPLLVAPFAESYLDTYSTIIASSFLYLLGLVALTLSAIVWSSPQTNTTRSFSFLTWSLCLISIGLGGYHPSLQAFAAIQYKKEEQEQEEEELHCGTDDVKKSGNKAVSFQWWYLGICVGSLLGITVMSYIQDNFGWVMGFAIPAVSVASSIVLFLCGNRIYAYKREDGSTSKKPFKNMVPAITSSASKLMNSKISIPKELSEMAELELQEQPLCQENITNLDEIPKRIPPLHSKAKVVLRLLPIWTMLLTFAVIFQQPATFFTKQGMAMTRNIGSNFMIPPATLQSAITLSIILLMPLYDKIFIPIAKLVTHADNGITVMQRMGIGMVLSIIAMVIAALVEMKRRTTELGPETAPLSICWLLPQYILLGISDIFTVVGMLEFFNNEVPDGMKTTGSAIYNSVFGVGSFVSALLITTVEFVTSSKGEQSWFCDNMREARLDNYYWLLAFLSCLSFLLYLLVCKWYKSRSHLENKS